MPILCNGQKPREQIIFSNASGFAGVRFLPAQSSASSPFRRPSASLPIASLSPSSLSAARIFVEVSSAFDFALPFGLRLASVVALLIVHAVCGRVSSRPAFQPCVVRALGVPHCALRILDWPCAFGAQPPRPCVLRRLRRGSSRRRPGPRQGDGANDLAEQVLGRVTAERLRRLEEALHLLGAAHPRPGALRHSLSSRGRRRLEPMHDAPVLIHRKPSLRSRAGPIPSAPRAARRRVQEGQGAPTRLEAIDGRRGKPAGAVCSLLESIMFIGFDGFVSRSDARRMCSERACRVLSTSRSGRRP